MTARDPKLLLQSAPFLRRGLTTPRLMLEVTLALVPVVAASIYYFGLSAILVLAASTFGALLAEWCFTARELRARTLRDYSAALTGLLLGLTLPPGVAMWMALLGGFVAIGLGKAVFGGLGQNLFNPALVGRAFLQAAFPTAMTTWSAQTGPAGFFQLRPGNLALPLMHGSVDAVTTATPLGMMKFEHLPTALAPLLSGNTAGSLGETCAALIIVCGVIMALRRLFDWRIPVAMVLAVALLDGVLWGLRPDSYPSPWFMVCSGGLLFGAVYMATDPVTSPVTPAGAWIFGCGAGTLVVLIRIWGGLPEGVMYAILLMNAATPLIERYTQPRAFGRRRAIA